MFFKVKYIGMEKKKIIILDFDGVFYSGEHIFDKVCDFVEEHRREFLPNVSDSDYEKICVENPDFVNALDGREISEQIYILKNKYPTLNIDIKGYIHCEEVYQYNIILDGASIIDAKVVEKICKKYPTYIVSNSSVNHIKRFMKIFGVEFDWFKCVYANQFEEFDPTKKHYMEEIAKKENVKMNDIYMFGDSQISDMQPAKSLGINGTLIVDSKDFEQVFKASLGIKKI